MDRCTVGRAARDKRHTTASGSTSASAGTDIVATPQHAPLKITGVNAGKGVLAVFLAQALCGVAELDSSERDFIEENEEYICPFCYGQSFAVGALLDHVNQEHAYQQRSAVRKASL